MKKKYIAPEMNVVDVEVAEMLAVSSIGYTDQKASNNYDALAKKRRGTWGDLWN